MTKCSVNTIITLRKTNEDNVSHTIIKQIHNMHIKNHKEEEFKCDSNYATKVLEITIIFHFPLNVDRKLSLYHP